MRTFLIATTLTVGMCLSLGANGSPKPTWILHLGGLDQSIAPSSIALGPTGDLYAVYRDHGERHQSGYVWVRVFDSQTGKELRNTRMSAPSRKLPQRSGRVMLSADGTTLLYAELPGVLLSGQAGFAFLLDTATLKRKSDISAGLLTLANLRVEGFNHDGTGVVLSSSIKDETNRVTKSVRVIQLWFDGQRVIADQTAENPFARSLAYEVDPEGSVWFSDNAGSGSTLARYDFQARKISKSITAGSQYGFAQVLWLRGAILATSNSQSGGQALNELYRFNDGMPEPKRAQHKTDCWFRDSVSSADETVVGLVCEATRGAEFKFGSVVVRNAFVFDALSLRLLATFPMTKRTASSGIAVWNNRGRLTVAASGQGDAVEVYVLSPR